MPELVAKKKSKPAINTFDFSFFEKHNGKHDRAMKVAIVTCKSYIKLSMMAYRKIKGPEYFKVGIDINNRVICVSPAVENEPFVIKPTASQIERNTIFISKSHSVIQKLKEIGIPKIVEGKLVDDELLFKF